LHEQRDANSLIVKEHAVTLFAMLSECLSVIGHDGDDRVLVQTAASQKRQELAHRRVRVSNLTVVRLGSITTLIGFRRIVRVVRVVNMNPDEELAGWTPPEPCQRVVHDFSSAALYAAVAVFSGLTLMEPSVVNIEPARKS